MSKPLAVPAMTMGSRFNPELTIVENAQAAWSAERGLKRKQNEKGARVLLRRIFRDDAFEANYNDSLDPTLPLYEIEGEAIAYVPSEGVLALMEFCGCGDEAKRRTFRSLAGLGRVIADRDDAEDFTCRECQFDARLAQVGKR